jgi:hypothetical protein
MYGFFAARLTFFVNSSIEDDNVGFGTTGFNFFGGMNAPFGFRGERFPAIFEASPQYSNTTPPCCGKNRTHSCDK